jgi:hypothetical protein
MANNSLLKCYHIRYLETFYDKRRKDAEVLMRKIRGYVRMCKWGCVNAISLLGFLKILLDSDFLSFIVNDKVPTTRKVRKKKKNIQWVSLNSEK